MDKEMTSKSQYGFNSFEISVEELETHAYEFIHTNKVEEYCLLYGIIILIDKGNIVLK